MSQNARVGVLFFSALLALPDGAFADQAIRLLLSNDFCIIQGCPGSPPPPPTVTASGVQFGIYVVAVSDHALDPSYLGTISFASTDPLATLPPSYTFLPEDRGDRAFTAILRTPGQQTITVSDSTGKLIPGTLVMTVTGQAPAESVPTISDWAKILLVVALASAGVSLARLKT